MADDLKTNASSSLRGKGSTIDGSFILVDFLKDLFSYIVFRLRQSRLVVWAFLLSIVSIGENIKSWAVKRMYWGRGSLYRSSFHIIVTSLTVVSLFVGISKRINITKDSHKNGLVLATGVIGNSDTLYQAGTTEAIVPVNVSNKPWNEYKYTVNHGDTLKSIADKYGVNSATIKWANNLPSERLHTDQILSIPELNGVLYEVRSGDTVAKVVAKIDNANEFDIRELNRLKAPNFDLIPGQKIFIPNGIVKAPKVFAGLFRKRVLIKFANPGLNIPPGTFINPLTFCPGYVITRGVLPWHTGVDMAKPGGCWANATSNGTVIMAGWGSFGQGFHVIIDHGNGFKSYYYHGNGNFSVSKGDIVTAGQKIFYMGTTGNSTGTHLHFEMRYHHEVVDPQRYMTL